MVKRKAPQDYFKAEFPCFRKKMRQEIDSTRQWSREQRDATISWLWQHPFLDRGPFMVACSKRVSKDKIFKLPVNVSIPDSPKKKNDPHNTPAAQNATDPAQGTTVPAQVTASAQATTAPAQSNVITQQPNVVQSVAPVPTFFNYPYAFWTEEEANVDVGSRSALEYYTQMKQKNSAWKDVLFKSMIFPDHIRKKIQDGENWKMVAKIGEGAFGIIILALRLDAENVIKEVSFSLTFYIIKNHRN